jgi:hypothetical protein
MYQNFDAGADVLHPVDSDVHRVMLRYLGILGQANLDARAAHFTCNRFWLVCKLCDEQPTADNIARRDSVSAAVKLTTALPGFVHLPSFEANSLTAH